MCGFAGVIAWDDQYRVSTDTLRKMAAAIAHRGPDGEGIFLNHDDAATPDRPQVGLAFRRLAILDPDPRSDQPFTDGRRTLVFNGEIYNFRELRAELSSGYDFKTTGDTEVLLAAYAAWGEKCVDRLNGMFAFAVWDEAEKTLFLARDRMGQKPLYVRHAGIGRGRSRGAIYFASELPAIPQEQLPWGGDGSWQGPWLADYLRYGVGTAFPIWSETSAYGPGGSMLLRVPEAGTDRRYFDAGRMRGVRHDDRTAVSKTRELVRQAVERQLVSDVPLGVFLSGGVDSSVIAACARRVGPVQTFSIRFDDPRYDESSYARSVASHLKTDHHEFTVTPEAVTDLPKLAAVFGEPFGDSSALPTHYLSRETRRFVKVALSGDGGDELFGGYDRYRAIGVAHLLRGLSFLRPLGRKLVRRHPKSFGARAGRFLSSLGEAVADQYDGYLRIFDDAAIARLAPTASRMFPLRAEAFQLVSYAHPNAIEASLACDRMRYLPDDLLTKVDRCSMLHGLEVRSPFMDHELVSFAAGLTADQLLKGGPKRMLREAFADDLPAWVFKRKKMGFAVPIGDWFRGPLRALLTDTLLATDAFGRSHFDMKVVQRLMDEHQSGRVDHSQRLYALLMLELWWRQARV